MLAFVLHKNPLDHVAVDLSCFWWYNAAFPVQFLIHSAVAGNADAHRFLRS